MKIAVNVGINKYPNPKNNLRGCVNDAQGWVNILKRRFNFDDVTMIRDRTATVYNVISTLKAKLQKCKSGDTFVFTNSSHGTSIKDKSGDEKDKRDEAICLYDGLLIDDQFRNILSKVPKGLNIIIISDSCHSGTVTRATLMAASGLIDIRPLEDYQKPRYLPPEEDRFAISGLPVNKKIFAAGLSQEGMNEVLLTGCQSHEYSYDAYFKGKFYGALTYNCLEILKRSKRDITYNQFYNLVRKRLPSKRYDQSPQLEGSKANRNRPFFQ